LRPAAAPQTNEFGHQEIQADESDEPVARGLQLVHPRRDLKSRGIENR
jgi:hypothetical protein